MLAVAGIGKRGWKPGLSWAISFQRLASFKSFSAISRMVSPLGLLTVYSCVRFELSCGSDEVRGREELVRSSAGLDWLGSRPSSAITAAWRLRRMAMGGM